MDAQGKTEPTATKNPTTMERKSERELVTTRVINGPARLVFEAFAKPELFKQWWVPKAFRASLVSYEADVRTGGRYRLVFRHGDSEMAFFGKYLEVRPHSHIVWTNEEGHEGDPVTTLTLEERGDQTLLVMHELYPTKEALDAVMASGEKSGTDEQFDQLDELLATLSAT